MGERDICTSWVVSTELEGTFGLILVLKIGNIGIMLHREGKFSKVLSHFNSMIIAIKQLLCILTGKGFLILFCFYFYRSNNCIFCFAIYFL